ncbi:glycosyltransferase family 2 protein [Pyrococcus yayanosii]|uniref:Glycosyltransferase n=1 Tax=Pyrococcus yayanosii (strain CH1 / JCM 16557) TaxID=529709 RepID=F8AHY6_PYRYC|nr:glycosyltransferase family 2 protein [Pyrococcus yayanosii]AEH25443.1 glycosyltransferase [Pyrococcus yayanosii CH1]
MFPRVSIIILNWNGWRDTIECLESVYRITYPNYDVIVVDNGSKDNSIQKIKEYAEGKIKVHSKFFDYNPNNKPIRVFEVSEDDAKKGKFNRPLYEKFDVNRRMILIKNRDNYGFAGGNNVGIKFALSVLNPDYVMLLNNDTVVDKKFLDELVKVAESDKKIGIAGPLILYYDHPTIVWAFGTVALRGKPKSYILYTPIEVPWVIGCALLLKADLLRSVGLLDENIFLYGEEYDLCLRARSQSYYLYAVPTSTVIHKEKMDYILDKPYKLYYELKHFPYVLRKNYMGANFAYVFLRYYLGGTILKKSLLILKLLKNQKKEKCKR